MAQDPTKAGPQPPQPPQQQDAPGYTDQMDPKPDHGEQSYKGSGKLTDRAAIITGGDSGIGRAVAIAFAREGADVLIAYLPEEEKDALDTSAWITEAGRKAVLVPGDITDQEHCKAIVEAGRVRVRQGSTSWSTTPRSSAPTRRSRTSRRRSGTAPSAPTSTRCSTCPRPPCRTCSRARRS
jgi:hypothetical protein